MGQSTPYRFDKRHQASVTTKGMDLEVMMLEEDGGEGDGVGE